jgi:hypothetical protein
MLFVQRLGTTACLTLCAAMAAFSQTMPTWLVPTPPQPVTIFTQEGTVHILSAQVDADFNGVQDEGDVPPHWIAVDAATRERVVTRPLPWGSNYVNRSAMAAGSLFTHRGDTLVKYDVATGIATTVAVTGAVSVAVTPDGAYAAVAVRPSFTDPGSVLLIDVAEGTTIAEVPTSVNPGALHIEYAQSELPVAAFHIVVVCEGLFGTPTSELVIIDVDAEGTPTRAVVELGDTGNGLAIVKDPQFGATIALIAMNGSHSVVAVNTETAEALATLDVGTTGYDGPRDVVFADGLTIVSTFSSDVRMFTPRGDVLATLKPGGKPEGLAIVNDQLWVTRAYVEGGYAADSGVAVFRFSDIISSVHETQQSQPSAVWPIPANSHVNVRGVTSQATVTSATGMQYSLPVVVTSDGVARFRVEALPNGIYAVHDGSVVHRFVVQR